MNIKITLPSITVDWAGAKKGLVVLFSIMLTMIYSYVIYVVLTHN